MTKTKEKNYPSSSPEILELARQIVYASDTVDPVTRAPVVVLDSTRLPAKDSQLYKSLLPAILRVFPIAIEKPYAIVFFAGAAPGRPSWSWLVNAYSMLDRRRRKNLTRFYIVHEAWWVRATMAMFTGVISPKARSKTIHARSLSELAKHLDISSLNIPLPVYLHDRKESQRIISPTTYAPIVGQDLPGRFTVPNFWNEVIDYLFEPECLETKGLFRVSPRQVLLDIAIEAIDRGQRMSFAEFGPYVSASVIKTFLNRLPTPPIPMEAVEMTCRPHNLSPLEIAKYHIPSQSLVLFSRLIPLLGAIAEKSTINQMSIPNLATCLLPCLVPLSLDSTQAADDCAQLQTLQKKYSAALLLIENFIKHWPNISKELGLEHETMARRQRPPLPPKPVLTKYSMVSLPKLTSQEMDGRRIVSQPQVDQKKILPPLPPRNTSLPTIITNSNGAQKLPPAAHIRTVIASDNESESGQESDSDYGSTFISLASRSSYDILNGDLKIPRSRSLSKTDSIYEGRMGPPPMVPQHKVSSQDLSRQISKPDSVLRVIEAQKSNSELNKRNIGPKPFVPDKSKGKIVQQLAQLYEERSQSANILVGLSAGGP